MSDTVSTTSDAQTSSLPIKIPLKVPLKPIVQTAVPSALSTATTITPTVTATVTNTETLVSPVEQIKTDEQQDKEALVIKPILKPLVKPIISKAVANSSATTSQTDDDTSTNFTTITTSTTDTYLRDRYKKLKHREQIYQLPDTYIGSIIPDEAPMWVMNDGRMENRTITYIPGLYKIFDEVLVNAVDQHIRMNEFLALTPAQLALAKNKPSCIGAVKNIRVTVSKYEISVENDGPGIDVSLHPDHKVYIPQLIFCELLTSTNYATDERRVVGGRNGYGAKLCNIFSTEFTIETVDSISKKHYKQVCRKNMLEIDPPIIKAYNAKPFTRITFKPDFARFNLPDGIPDDTIKIMEKRVWDCAAYTTGCNVFLNGEKILIKDFEKYAELFTGTKFEKKNRVYAKPHPRWEIIACPSWDHDFVQVSLVNGISTHRGGKHVEHVANQICKDLAKLMNDKSPKNKKTDIKASHVRKNLCLFIKAAIENPTFDTQTKECMTTLVKDFGSKCDINEEFIEALYKTAIKDKIMEFYSFKDAKMLQKMTDGKKKSKVDVEKLEEWEKPGTKESMKCTLILTEGDSAKSLAIAGVTSLPEKEMQYYGVFPLRGKLLNVREATMKQLLANEEIKNLKIILGLQEGKTYETDAEVQHLRYGRVMIMTDADLDGDHIKGLLFNFFHHFWPSFMRRQSSFCSLITPVVRIWKTMRKGQLTIPNPKTYRNFYTLPEFESWKTANGGSMNGYEYKYYKGLGTSNNEEAAEYFNQMKVVSYEWDNQKFDTETSEMNRNDYALQLAFQKDKADDRKVWLSDFNPNVIHNYEIKKESYYDFIMKRLRAFSYEDIHRSIPSVLDGLKPSQRKILFGCLRKKLTKKEMKVAQLASYVALVSAYHHGEQNISGTIVGMAHKYIGSNNINLLMPNGQFGDRLGGRGPAGSEGLGKNFAAPRYIYTRLSDVSTLIFNSSDAPLLKYLEDDEKSIEPIWYIPCLPMVLINGAEGIGTGYSTNVPNYKPAHVIENLKRLMNGEELIKMRPWYRGFQGDIIVQGSHSFASHGVYTVKDQNTIEITEIPVGPSSQTMALLDYKEFLNSIISGKINLAADGTEKAKKHPLTGKIADATINVTPDRIKATLKFMPNTLGQLLADKAEFEKSLKLVLNINTSNMHLIDPQGKIKKYDTPEEILMEYYGVRLVFYEERKRILLDEHQAVYDKASAKAQFIKDIHAGRIKLNDPKPDGSAGVKPRPKKDIVEQLIALKYPIIKPKKPQPWDVKTNGDGDDDDDDNDNVSISANGATQTNAESANSPEEIAKGYNYLFTLKIDHLTDEQIRKLELERDIAYDKLELLKKKTAQNLWVEDLDQIQNMLKDVDALWYESAGIKPDTQTPLCKSPIDIKFRPSPTKIPLNLVKKTPPTSPNPTETS
jgi:DNA topoisomerase II